MASSPPQVMSLHSSPVQQNRLVKQHQGTQTLTGQPVQVFAPPGEEPKAAGAASEDPSRPHSLRWPRPQQQQLQLRGVQDSRTHFAGTPSVLTPKDSRTYFQASPGVLTPKVQQRMPPYSLMMPAFPSARHPAPHSVRGQSYEPPRGRALATQPMMTQTTFYRSRSGTPTREYAIIHKPAASVVWSHKPQACKPGTQSIVKQVASPSRLRTAVAPMATVPAGYPQVSIQTTSATAAPSKEKAISPTASLCSTLQRIPAQQVQSQPAGQSANAKGGADVVEPQQQQQQQQQFQQAVTAKLQAHQLAQASVTVPTAGHGETAQIHPVDSVRTIQLSPESIQPTIPRPSAENSEAERRIRLQSWKELERTAVKELDENKKGIKELQAQILKAQGELDSIRRDKQLAEQELVAKGLDFDKQGVTNRKLEGEKRLLENGPATLQKQLSEKNEAMRGEHEELQHMQERSTRAREEAQCLQDQVGELVSKLASAEQKAECRRQLHTDSQAAEMELEAQRREIQDLHNRIHELKRINDLQEGNGMQPPVLMPTSQVQQQNMELQMKLANAQGDLYNVLQQLQWKRGEAMVMRAG